jgi:tetratricopeptide (TPR) repeat protein
MRDPYRQIASLVVAQHINPGDTRAYVNRGNYYFNRQDYARALPDYDRAIERKPDNEIAYSNRGGLLASTGQLDRALTDFDHARQLKPYFLDAIRGRALVFYAQRQYDRALKDCEHYVALNPTADMLGLRGLAYQGLGRAREAEADLTRAIQLDPKAPGYYRDRSLLYSQLGDRTRALQDARIAQSLGAPIDSAYLRSLE